MDKLLVLMMAALFAVSIKAQAQYINSRSHTFGIIDTADLKLSACDFEKDANAEVLFDKAIVICHFNGITMERHVRIKIFNEPGEKVANIRLPYPDETGSIRITDAETINLTNNTINFTPVESKLIYRKKIDKYFYAVVFTFPNVRPGSVIEFKYKQSFSLFDFPSWIFQNAFPTRYSEFCFNTTDARVVPNTKINTSQPFVVDTTVVTVNNYAEKRMHIWALSNTRSIKKEPFTDFPLDYLQYIRFYHFHLSGLYFIREVFLKYDNFGKQLNIPLLGSKQVDSIKAFGNDDLKIATAFKLVKKKINWNGINFFATNIGVKKAWETNTGNSAEVNLILYNILKQVGIKCSLFVLSTRDHGRLDINDIYFSSFNKTIVYAATGPDKTYLLDAADKYNNYNDIPLDLLNLNGIWINENDNIINNATIVNNVPAIQTIYTEADIKPDGTMEGNSTITGYSYNKSKLLRVFDLLGKQKYIDSLEKEHSSLKINSFVQQNAENDTLPLIQDINFKVDLPGSDEHYIYFSPTLFSPLEKNPFISEQRLSDIDFLYCSSYKMQGVYRIPAGYKVVAMPPNKTLTTQDSSITFQRIGAEEDGAIHINYIISYKRSTYSRSEYGMLFEFYQKMYEMLNEQIALQKQ